ncbi:uncharacterized protein LOC117505071 [Thalassophryne amazonica]|uniref:uncharacterized protein LOC117505071 n=1 Tax=Thalassophryne amazonica TaxID=390379 RepID=UPI001471F704|nr:uncharacterized protein LOC117505071 [Thalassophryne amazonica]
MSVWPHYSQRSYNTAPTVKYNGLWSEGSSCSLNSVLQVLFMTREFREAVQRHTFKNPSSPYIDHYLQTLFAEMEMRTGSTANIRKALGIQNVFQQDVGVENFEKILSLTSPEASQIFCGKLVKNIKCCGCGTENNIDFTFWSLPLELVNSSTHTYSVVEGVEQFFKPVISDQVYCERCGKTNASVETKITTLPDVLTLMLKRIEHSDGFLRYDVICCPVDVPFTLFSPQNQTYSLYAVVDRHDTHYSASIKSPDDDTWRMFSDYLVMVLHHESFQDMNIRSSSAYLLFYRKQKTADVRGAGSPEDLQTEAVQIKQTDEDEGEKEERGDTAEGPAEKGQKDMSMSGSAGTRQRTKKEESPGEGYVGKQGETAGTQVLGGKQQERRDGQQVKRRDMDHETSARQKRTSKHVGGGVNAGQDTTSYYDSETMRDTSLRHQDLNVQKAAEVDKKKDAEHFLMKAESSQSVRSSANKETKKVSKNDSQTESGASPALVKYHGLMNRGQTCDLNSVLQVLFMTSEFREAVRRHTYENPNTNFIDRHLQTLFDGLKIQTCSADIIMKALDRHNGTDSLHTDPLYERRDAAEYFQRILRWSSPEASQVFCSVLTHKNKCSRCGMENNTDCLFWNLPLTLENSYHQDYHVVVGVEQFFKPSEMSGDNQMYCEHCGTKTDVSVERKIKTHPQVLILLLKRFEFNRRSQRCERIDCRVDVPCSLHIPQNQRYELYAAVRDAQRGADIKSPDGDGWYRFQDSSITPLHHESFQDMNISFRSSSAYLLFYRKQKTADGLNQDVRGAGSPEDLQTEAAQNKQTEEDEEEKEERGDTAEGPAEKGQKDMSRSAGTRQRTKKEESPREGYVGKQGETAETHVRGEVDQKKDGEYKGESSHSVRSSAKKETKKGRSKQDNNKRFSFPAPIKYHGLRNQGQTCYLNSVLQVLFMTSEFREAVGHFDTWKTRDSSCPNYLDHHLKSLFDEMKKTTCSPVAITKVLGIQNVFQQQDAAVYLDKILGLTSPQASKIFHGELTHRNVCRGCEEENNTDASFWSLPLELVDSNNEHYSVVEGVQRFFQTSEISGENQIYCERCSAKANASVSRIIKTHPDVLMLLLKRFELSYTYMTFVKIECSVDIPYVLHLPQDQTYELYALVNHAGHPGGGHYTATVKAQDGDRWYNFNDSTVTAHQSGQFQDQSVLRSHSAYLLFYRRKSKHATGTGNDDHSEDVSAEGRHSEAATYTHTDERARAGDESHHSASYGENLWNFLLACTGL